jgi:hypothetical protein
MMSEMEDVPLNRPIVGWNGGITTPYSGSTTDGTSCDASDSDEIQNFFFHFFFSFLMTITIRISKR